MQKKLVKSSYLSSIGTNFGVHAFSRTDSATTKLTLDSRDVTALARRTGLPHHSSSVRFSPQFVLRVVDNKTLANFFSK